MFWVLVKLGLGGRKTLGLLISALNSSASCWLSLVHAASMTVMYSKLGGCLGDTTTLDPLARTELCAWVKGLLDRLMTHLGLGSSKEEPWGSLLGGRGLGAFPGTSATCLGSSTVPLGSLGGLHLVECLPACLPACLSYCLPAWVEELLPAWEGPSLVGMLLGELHCLPEK